MVRGGSGSSQPPPPPPPSPPPDCCLQKQAVRSGDPGGWQQSSQPQPRSSGASPGRAIRPSGGPGQGSSRGASQMLRGHVLPDLSQQSSGIATASTAGGASAAPRSPAAGLGDASGTSPTSAGVRSNSGAPAGGGSLSPAARMPGIPGTGAGLGTPVAASISRSPGERHQHSAAAAAGLAEVPRRGLVIDIGTDSE
jgi:hypothetical protein